MSGKKIIFEAHPLWDSSLTPRYLIGNNPLYIYSYHLYRKESSFNDTQNQRNRDEKN